MAIANKTQYYALPLPIGSETMEYQDFINDTNNLLDAALHNIATSANQASQAAAAAQSGVSAADTKIEAIQTDLTEWNIPALKTEVNSIDSRLEVVEDDVMSFINPEIIQVTRKGIASNPVIKSGGLLIIPAQTYSGSPDRNEACTLKYLNKDNTPLSTSNNGYEICTIPGNIFNLPENNTLYEYSKPGMIFDTASTSDITRLNVGLLFNGVNTMLYAMLPSSTIGTYFSTSFIVPLGVY